MVCKFIEFEWKKKRLKCSLRKVNQIFFRLFFDVGYIVYTATFKDDTNDTENDI